MFRSSIFGGNHDYHYSLAESFARILRKLMILALLMGLAYFCAANSDIVLAVFRLFAQFLKKVLLELAQM